MANIARMHICEGCDAAIFCRGLPAGWTGYGTSVKALLGVGKVVRVAEWCPACVKNGVMDRESLNAVNAKAHARSLVGRVADGV